MTGKTENEEEKIVIILVRGLVNVRHDIKKTLLLLGLQKKFACVIKSKDKETLGMVHKVKDYVTWGEINEETYNELVEKRGLKTSDGSLKKYFRLHPPQGGFERKGTKTGYSAGGALGYRAEKINDLVQKMI
ncbi:MAG: uL30 family ribosomal protein [Nanoarchaeota archaeon]